MTKGEIFAGVIGGLITSIAIPITSYFISRFINKCLVWIKIDTPRSESDYRVYNLRIQNKSFVTLKNVKAFISIDNSKNDIISKKESGIEIFNDANKVDNSYLSWSQNIANANLPSIDISQGVSSPKVRPISLELT